MKKLLVCVFSLLLFTISSSEADERVIDEELYNIPDKHGLLFMELEVDGVAPSIEIVRLNKKGKIAKRSLQKIQIVEKDVLLLPLKEGHYQITMVNAPFYNLPYKFKTEKSLQWRFSIEKQQINYVGTLHIGADRSKSAVDILLINRLATRYKAIVTAHSSLLSKYSLRMARGYRDDFLENFQQ